MHDLRLVVVGRDPRTRDDVRHGARLAGARIVGAGSDLNEGLEAAATLGAEVVVLECESAEACREGVEAFSSLSPRPGMILLPPAGLEGAAERTVGPRGLVVMRHGRAIEAALRTLAAH